MNSALIPDNVSVPSGMKITQRLQDRNLFVDVEVIGGKSPIETLISTLDEFLSHIYAVSETLDRIVEIADDRHQDPKGISRKSKGKLGEAEHHKLSTR